MPAAPSSRGFTFTKWLVQFRGEHTALGDFARQVARDTDWQDPPSLAALESALLGAGRPPGEMQTARRAWLRYTGDRPTPRGSGGQQYASGE